MILFVMIALITFGAALGIGIAGISPFEWKESRETSNKQLVRSAFDRWHAGTGGPFELLADEAHWTIVGSSPVSRTYESKEQFMAAVIRPFNARMEQPLRPTIRHIYAEEDNVIVVFDAESRCVDGQGAIRPMRRLALSFGDSLSEMMGRSVEVGKAASFGHDVVA